MSAVGVTRSTLADQRFVIFGAGSAGLGIARQLRDGIVALDGVDRALDAALSALQAGDREAASALSAPLSVA